MPDKKVLILDDNKEFLEEFAEALNLNGYETIAVNDTDGFLDVVTSTKPAVILLDLKMPKKTGFLVALELLTSPSASCIPVILMSSFIKKGDPSPKELSNVIACIEKPIDLPKALAEIEKACRRCT